MSNTDTIIPKNVARLIRQALNDNDGAAFIVNRLTECEDVRLVDAIGVTAADGSGIAVDDFEALDGWYLIGTPITNGFTLTLITIRTTGYVNATFGGWPTRSRTLLALDRLADIVTAQHRNVNA